MRYGFQLKTNRMSLILFGKKGLTEKLKWKKRKKYLVKNKILRRGN